MSPKSHTTKRSEVKGTPSQERRLRALVVAHSTAPGALFAVHRLEPRRVVVGRDPGKDGIAIPDEEISRSHFALAFVPSSGVFRVEDLGSSNGTYLDGRKVESDYVQPGSVLRAGSTLLVYSELKLLPGVPDLALGPGDSFSRLQAEALVDLVAPTRTPVLVLGPTGAGKERLAERLHRASGREGPLVAVNCATFNRELIGSELFGHVKGAFSGALQPRTGLFAEADRGTLFLDEIAELPLDQQPALLRVLQEGRIRPVGGEREQSVDVRVVAATHQSLADAVERGTFRSDLYSRLAGLAIEIEGLKTRREEILPLFSAFTGGLPLTPRAAEALLLYEWPRNVRELQRAAERAVLFGKHAGVIDLELLPPEVQRAAASDAEGEGEAPKKDELEALLRRHGGNVAEVCRALDKHRQQVYRWLRMYKLNAADFREGGD